MHSTMESGVVDENIFRVMDLSGNPPSWLPNAKRAAQILLDDRVDPATRVQVVAAYDSLEFQPRGLDAARFPTTMTLKELADYDLPITSIDNILVQADHRGINVRVEAGRTFVTHPAGIDSAFPEEIMFTEPLEALGYLANLPLPAERAVDLGNPIQRLMGTGGDNRSSFTDAIVDRATRFTNTQLVTDLVASVRNGDTAVTVARTGDRRAFNRAFDLSNGDLEGSLTQARRELGADADFAEEMAPHNDVVSVTLNPTHDPADMKNLSVDQQKRIMGSDSVRVAVINKPLAKNVLAIPKVQELLTHLGVNPNQSVEQVVRELDMLPKGMDIFLEDPVSAAMYTYTRMHGMPEWFRGSPPVETPHGLRRIFSPAQKQEFEQKGMWTAKCKILPTTI